MSSADSSSSPRPHTEVNTAVPDGTAMAATDLIAYRLPGSSPARIVPATAARAWMREMVDQFANRCLPLLMANQSGWLLLNPQPLSAVWNGSNGMSGVSVEYEGGTPEFPIATSVFGYGILTWRIDYLFRTPAGYNLLVAAPSNMPRDGIHGLQGVVETDWAVASFTMNWKFTRPDQPVEFGLDEPFCMVVPQRRGELEGFRPRIQEIAEEPRIAGEWREFERRRKLMAALRHFVADKGGAEAVSRVPWERQYMQGTTPLGTAAPEHQKKLSLRPFENGSAAPDADAS
jgi:hypothetical protein